MDSLEMQQTLDSLVILDSLEIAEDTIVPVRPFYELWSDSDLTDIEMRALDWSLRWLDTTDCVATHDTTTLPDSVYKARLQALPCVVELPYNDRVRAFILRYVKRSPKQVARLMRMSEYYFPIFEEALGRHDLPYELKYLPIIESALNPMARSYVGAAGLWQFMPGSGKAFGLERNAYVDDRLDTYRSTEAACKLLKRLYSMYGDWAIVIAAYNCGSGTIRGAIKAAGGKKSFWAIYPYLPKQTRIYMPIFIAYNYVIEYADAYNIPVATIDNLAVPVDTVHTNKRMTLQQIAKATDTPIETVRMMNPQYLQGVTPAGRDNIICLPKGKAQFIRKNVPDSEFNEDKTTPKQ